MTECVNQTAFFCERESNAMNKNGVTLKKDSNFLNNLDKIDKGIYQFKK